jgi:holo-[acyl-carrier protein] synthase
VSNEREENQARPGVGVDIVDVGRIGSMVERHGDRFLKKVFTEGEVAYATAKKRMFESLAVRFAAKEAFMKAVGRRLPWRDIEVAMRGSTPSIRFGGKTYDGVSLSHERAYAVAVVHLSTGGPA